MTDCLLKAKDRLKKIDDKRAVRALEKIIPLFDKHDFWDTQPVMHVYKPIDEVNKPIEF